MIFPEDYKYQRPNISKSQRFIPVNSDIPADKYNLGWGMDLDLYMKIQEARKDKNLLSRETFTSNFDSRSGYYIDGAEIVTNPHPYHNMWLVDNETGERFHIDVVSYHHQHGQYISVSKRAEGSQSHGMVILKNLFSHDPFIIKQVAKAEKQYTLVPK